MKKTIIGKDKATGKQKLQIFVPIDERQVSEEKILKKYPKIFKQKNSPMTQTCMCWGLEVGLGWHWLVDILCSQLQWDIDRNNHEQIEATQVKEKFGTLRFYTNGADKTQEGMISLVEFMSTYICEKCGSTENVTQTKGWIATLCKNCMSKRVRGELK
jgi:DNA-directed RNA polymerase subunit RPC12/RpoP